MQKNNARPRQRSGGSFLLTAPYIIWMTVFILIPLGVVVFYALTDPVTGLFSLGNLSKIFTGAFPRIFLRSVWYSLVASLICLVIGYPVAYFIARQRPGVQRFLYLLVMLPMCMSFLLRTLAWQTLLEKNGVINGILSALHLPTQSLINTSGAIILGMVYNFLPFMILPIYNVLAKIDDNTINAAKDLGANNFQTLIHIWIPLSIPGIISGITMVFVPALTTFVISSLLGGSKILLIGNVIEQEFTKGSNWHLGSGLSLVLMIFILLSMALIAKYDKEGEGNAF